MSTIIKKKIKKKIYYYYAESVRINGKPRIVNQKYLGTAESILERATAGLPQPLYSKVLDFGDISLLYDIASRLGVVEIVNHFAQKRNQGVSIGDYILTAAINRVVCPTSESSIQAWLERTMLPQIMHVDPRLFSPQNYWNNMSLPDRVLDDIEDTLLKKMLDTYDIDTTRLIYDATNFFTYISTKQDSELAKRGHSKEKRNDLKIVGLSMMVSPDHSIPLLYETYSGNRSDAKQFTVMLNRLRDRYQQITNKQTDITVVFDRGNNAQYNIDILESEDCPMYYVGGLKRNQCEELLTIPESEYTSLEGIKGSRTIRRKMTVFEREMTVVTVYNQNLFDGQMQGIRINIEKTHQQLTELQIKLLARHTGEVKKGKKPSYASVEKQVKRILDTEFMSDVYIFKINNAASGIPLLEFEFNDEAFEKLQATVLGKTVLFTNRHEWPDVEIVTAYRSAWRIEHAFRQMKDTNHLTVRPIFHWTDAKIKVHIFYCVLAFRLCCILRKELEDFGIHDSLDHILDELKQYKYVITVIGHKKTDIISSLTQPSKLTSTVLEKYALVIKYLRS